MKSEEFHKNSEKQHTQRTGWFKYDGFSYAPQRLFAKFRKVERDQWVNTKKILKSKR